MKKILCIVALLGFINHSFAQNSNPWPITGNVGIGTASPTELLHVNGNARVLKLGIGGSPVAYTNFQNSANLTGASTSYANFTNGVIQSDVATAVGYVSAPQISATSALTNLQHYVAQQGSIVAGGSVASQYGFSASSNLTGATNNYGFYGAIAAGTGRWNTYMAGTANNYFAGNVGIGTTAPFKKLHVSGGTLALTTGDFLSSGTGSALLMGQDGASGNVYSLIQAAIDGPNAGGILALNPNGGNVSIGTIDPKGYKLAVNGSAIATSMTVKLNSAWPDYVFKKEYKLPTLTEVKDYIEKNKHLPDMPSEKQVTDNGLNLGEMNRILTKKVEELTLYFIEQYI
jgi:hypothetical protein